MVRIILESDESVPQIEAACSIIDGVNLNCSNADMLREVLGPSKRVNQEMSAQPTALGGSCDREPSQEHNRHVDVRQTLGLIRRQRFIAHRMARKRIVTQNDGRFIRRYGHIHACQIAALELARPLREPLVQPSIAAIELPSIMMLGKPLDDPGGGHFMYLL
jgi:hypothetical protein